MRRAVVTLWVVARLVVCAEAVRGEEPVLIAPPPTMERALRFVLAPEEPIPSPPATASPGERPLTLTEAESLAERLHPALREAEGRLRAARGNWLQVGLRPNPAVGYSGMQIGDDGSAGQQGGFLQQEFVTAGKLGLNRAVASREVAAAEQRYTRTRLQLVTTVRTFYFEALAAERAGALARQLTSIAAQSAQVSESLLKAGEGSRASLLQAQIQRDSAALLEQQATNRREAAWRRLATLLGMENEAAKPLEDMLQKPLPELNWEQTRDRVLAESPELAALRFEVDRARLAVDRARAGRVPNVTAQAGAAQDDATGDTIANVQISMPIPIFDRNQGGIAQACGELTAAQAALRQRELQLEQRLAAAMRDYATARQRVGRYAETIIPAAKQALDITNRAYEQGELDYLQVLTVQTTYTQNNLSYLQDLEAAWKQWAEIDALLVGSLPEGGN